MDAEKFTPYNPPVYESDEVEEKASAYRDLMSTRRSVRMFSDTEVSRQTIEDILLTAASAPSGAHKQPWTFAAVSNAEMKAKIREAAEQEEYTNYHGRMSEEWLEDLKKFDTNWVKDFITTAPWIIVIFKKTYDVTEEGDRTKNYYVNESVGIAAGFLISAIHHAGLATLTHTPSPMNFLEKLLSRPKNEKAYLLLPVGYPAPDAEVPVLKRKGLNEVSVFWE